MQPLKVLCSILIGAIGGWCFQQEEKCKTQVNNSSYHPMRIKYKTVGFESLSIEQAEFTKKAMESAISYWSKTLRVRDRDVGAVHYARPCRASTGTFCNRVGKFELSDGNSANYDNDALNSISSNINYDIGYSVNIDVNPFDIDGLEIFECSDGSVNSCVLTETIPPMSGGSEELSDVDLFINAIYMDPFFDQAVARYTVSGYDECGRAVIGNILISNKILSGITFDSAVNIFIHEMTHMLGFNTESMDKWVSRLTGEVLVNRVQRESKILNFWIGFDTTIESLKVVLSDPPEGFKQRSVFIPNHIVNMVNEGEDEIAKCRCPLDLDKSFTGDDVLVCITKPSDCRFGIMTETVISAAREFYNCDTLKGMELDNSIGGIDSHWNSKVLRSEMMTPELDDGEIMFISPMTLALLTDTGWYLVDEKFGQTQLVRGIHWGFQDGCAIVHNRLVEKKPITDESGSFIGKYLLLPYTHRELDGSNVEESMHPTTMCSSDGFSSVIRSMKNDMDHYRSYFESNLCPLAETNYQLRCIDIQTFNRITQNYNRNTDCVSILCNTNKGSYSFYYYEESLECFEEGQELFVIVGDATNKIICRDPSVTCAQLNYPHYPANSGLNRPPGHHLQIANIREEGLINPHKSSSLNEEENNDGYADDIGNVSNRSPMNNDNNGMKESAEK